MNHFRHTRSVSLVVALAISLLLIAGPLSAAAPTAAPQVVSPEVIHTGTGPTGYEVTFRYYDAAATSIRIKGEWYFSDAAHGNTTAGYLPTQWQPGYFPIGSPNSPSANWPVAEMTNDGAGVWSYTTPLPSGVFSYAFYRNCTAAAPGLSGCTAIPDPMNMPWNAPAVSPSNNELTSQVYVPSDPAFGTLDNSWQAANPVHGSLTEVAYASSVSTNPVGVHAMAIYTPPGYDPNRAVPYPVFYLMHGGGGNEVDWSTQGVAGKIMDNLIASGKTQPMIIVMPTYRGITGVANGSTDILNNVIPYVESHYNVSHDASSRAFAALSQGGQHVNDLLFNHTTSIGYYSVMSAGGQCDAGVTGCNGGIPPVTSPLWANPDLKTRLGIQITAGLQDGLYPSDLTEDNYMTTFGIPHVSYYVNGGHNWAFWRQAMRDFVIRVAFRHTTTTLSQGALGGGRFVAATVKADTAEPARPRGTVQFYVDGQKVEPARPLLADGSARLNLQQIGAGAHTVTAVYSGDNYYNTSTSAALSVAR